MDIELFTKTYTPLMMQIIRRYAEGEAETITRIVLTGNHYQLRDVIENIKNLADARMLLSVYPGCEFCFGPECQSDHK